MCYKNVPHNQSDALKAGYWNQAHGLPPTTEQIAHRAKLGIYDTYTASVTAVIFKLQPYTGADDRTYRRKFADFNQFVSFCRTKSPAIKEIRYVQN